MPGIVRKQRVKPRWKTDPSGLIVMSIRSSNDPVHIQRAKFASAEIEGRKQVVWGVKETDFKTGIGFSFG